LASGSIGTNSIHRCSSVTKFCVVSFFVKICLSVGRLSRVTKVDLDTPEAQSALLDTQITTLIDQTYVFLLADCCFHNSQWRNLFTHSFGANRVVKPNGQLPPPSFAEARANDQIVMFVWQVGRYCFGCLCHFFW
jgi:hypothetical protein